jgi:hypothetical protein
MPASSKIAVKIPPPHIINVIGADGSQILTPPLDIKVIGLVDKERETAFGVGGGTEVVEGEVGGFGEGEFQCYGEEDADLWG